MPTWLLPGSIGLLVGVFVSAFNHLILLWAIRRDEKKGPQEKKDAVIKIYLVRYAVSILVLLLFRKNTVMLLAVGLGLILCTHFLFFKQYFRQSDKKGGNL